MECATIQGRRSRKVTCYPNLGGVGQASTVGGMVTRVLLFRCHSLLWLLAEDFPTHEPLYRQYHIQWYYFFVLPFAAMFICTILIASAKNNGTTQIVIIGIELLLLLSHAKLRPGKTCSADILHVFLSVVRLVTAGLLVSFFVPVTIPPIL